jgi:hypothetical protein
MAEAQVNVQVSGNAGSSELRQRLQEVVDANRIAMNLRMQAKITVIKAQRG